MVFLQKKINGKVGRYILLLITNELSKFNRFTYFTIYIVYIIENN